MATSVFNSRSSICEVQPYLYITCYKLSVAEAKLRNIGILLAVFLQNFAGNKWTNKVVNPHIRNEGKQKEKVVLRTKCGLVISQSIVSILYVLLL